jgi:hypothetical protein
MRRDSRIVAMPIVTACVGTWPSSKRSAFACRVDCVSSTTRAGVERRAGLIEADVAVAAEAEEREIESAGSGDVAFVLFRRVCVREMRVRRIEVDVIEEMLLHVAEVAARMFARQAGVLVEVERRDVPEAVVFA